MKNSPTILRDPCWQDRHVLYIPALRQNCVSECILAGVYSVTNIYVQLFLMLCKNKTLSNLLNSRRDAVMNSPGISIQLLKNAVKVKMLLQGLQW